MVKSGIKLTDPYTAARHILYLASPNETSFAKLEDVPKYYEEVLFSSFRFLSIEIPS